MHLGKMYNILDSNVFDNCHGTFLYTNRNICHNNFLCNNSSNYLYIHNHSPSQLHSLL